MTAVAKKAKSIRLSYDLFDLPTAQHKAGLAGLLLLIRHLQQPALKLDREQIPIVESVSATSLTIQVTEASIQQLFDYLYDAEIREVSVKSKWAGSKPKRVEETQQTDPETKKTKIVKSYVYDVVTPLATFLEQHYPGGDGIWLKLWRDMIWSIPRGRPTTRIPFNQRAEGATCGEGAAMWKELLAFDKARAKNQVRTCRVAGATLLGAQAVNAEQVPFHDRSDQALLLHFWQFVVQIFVPQEIDKDGSGEFVGYALAIPEVANLEEFCEDYPQMLHDLDKQPRGYRPAAAVIDIPAQAALEFMRNLAQLVQQRSASHGSYFSESIAGIEYLHLVKVGNNVKSMSAGRVAQDPELLKAYLAIMQPSGPNPAPYRNPLFRAAVLTSLLIKLRWFDAMVDMLHERDWRFFIRCPETPRGMPFFGRDAENKFKSIQTAFRQDLEVFEKMTDENTLSPQPPLEMLIHRLIRTYVRAMTENRCGIKWEQFKDKKIKDEKTQKERTDIPQAYREAKEKVVSDAFLGMRSRREQDFVDFFTARICRVSQYLNDDEFQLVSKALLDNPHDVKTIAMLSLSANS